MKGDHYFDIRSDYPNHSPAGMYWVGHYYKCSKCGLEVGHPSHLTEENESCPVWP